MSPATSRTRWRSTSRRLPPIGKSSAAFRFRATNIPSRLPTTTGLLIRRWNVNRLRPAALGPFDYTREDYTPSLWFAEGVTSYYAYVHLRRAGLWSRDEFLGHFAGEIGQLEIEPGRLTMSAESSSFHAW